VARDFSRLQNVELLEDIVLRECDATSLGNRFLTIRDDILATSSGVGGNAQEEPITHHFPEEWDRQLRRCADVKTRILYFLFNK
jgi:hypothetical protein